MYTHLHTGLSLFLKLANIFPNQLQTVCSPLLLQGSEGLPESRADLTEQLDQRVAKDFRNCRFRVEDEGS